MKLSELLKDLITTGSVALNALQRPVTGLVLDSRQTRPGNVFIALDGTRQHGMQHAGQAIALGASAILFDPKGEGKRLADAINTAPCIAVELLNLKLGEIAARFYGEPSRFMNVIGITGTNGKTSCSQFLGQVLDAGIIGTLGWGQWGQLNKTLNTTPDALAVQAILFELLNARKESVAMEVSSHGLDQGRVNSVHFKGVVFTNISRDHLDYHGTMESYLETKLRLLQSPDLEFAVVNLDDAYSEQIIAAIPDSVVLWGVSAKGKKAPSGEGIVAESVLHKASGIEFLVRWNDRQQLISVPLFGDFNAENTLCVLAVMLALGISLKEAATRLARIKPVTGRMESFGGENQPLVFVDYAHTPDALDKVLASMKQHCKQELWVVFGCGGNRDQGKRPQMGKIAEQWADHVIITDDNPRFEDGSAIVQDILVGCGQVQKIEVIQNREQAIHKAITTAKNGDVIVIAGKGHEDYQEINGVQTHFCDKEQVLKALEERG